MQAAGTTNLERVERVANFVVLLLEVFGLLLHRVTILFGCTQLLLEIFDILCLLAEFVDVGVRFQERFGGGAGALRLANR